MHLFADKGYENTTIKEIAETCGITEAFVLRHFPSKDAIWMTLYERWKEKNKEPRTVTFSGNSASEMLLSIGCEWVRGYRSREGGDILRRAIEGRHNVDDLILEGVRLYPDFTTTRVLPVVLLGQQTGEFRKGDSFLIARSYFACVAGLAYQRLSFPERYENFEDILQVYISMLQVDAPEQKTE